MAYRTRRAFRDQLHALALISQFEAARAAAERGRRPARGAQRHLVAISDALAEALSEPSLRQVAALELLPRVREYLDADFRTTERRRPSESPLSPKVGAGFTAACLLAWIAAFGQVAAHGISNRPSLIVTELVAIVLTPVATLLALPR